MYKDESDYIYPKDNPEKGKDFWYTEYQGQKIKVTRETGGGTLTHFGGPCGPLYLDKDGNS